MVGTTDTVLIREVSFIEKFHCTGCCGVLVGAVLNVDVVGCLNMYCEWLGVWNLG